MPRVWVYNEKRFDELGATRWSVDWYTLSIGGERRYREGVRRDPNYDVDFDRDLECNYRHFKTKAAAVRFARKIAGESFFGVANVVKEILDWMSEDDGMGCFEECGEREEVAA